MNETEDREQIEAEMLDVLVWELEKEICNYEMEVIEDLYDEDGEEVVRRLRWSRGDKTHEMVISPYGQFKYIEKKTPLDLIIQVNNKVVICISELFAAKQ